MKVDRTQDQQFPIEIVFNNSKQILTENAACELAQRLNLLISVKNQNPLSNVGFAWLCKTLDKAGCEIKQKPTQKPH